MKGLIILLLIPFCGSFVPITPLAEKTDLLKAMSEGLIKVKATSLGLNAEECVQLKITNLSSRKLNLIVNPGTVFHPTDESTQDILVTRPTEVVAEASKPATAKAYGFCCAASKGLPKEGGEMRIQACTNNQLIQTAQKLSAKPYSPDLQQHTVWAVSDNHSIGGIWSDSREQSSELREFTAKLLGQPVPTYDVDYGYELNTPFVFAPKSIKGEMSFRVTKPGRASLCVYNPDGQLFQTFFENKYLASGQYSQRFSYTSSNLAPGDYIAKLIVDGMEWRVQTIRI